MIGESDKNDDGYGIADIISGLCIHGLNNTIHCLPCVSDLSHLKHSFNFSTFRLAIQVHIVTMSSLQANFMRDDFLFPIQSSFKNL